MTCKRHHKTLSPFMIGLAWVAASSAPALAQTSEARFAVRANVSSTCVISTESTKFSADTRPSIECTNGARWTVSEHSGLRPVRRFLVRAGTTPGAEARMRVITVTY